MANKVMKGGGGIGTGSTGYGSLGSGSGSALTEEQKKEKERKEKEEAKREYQRDYEFTKTGGIIKNWKKIIFINLDQGRNNVLSIIADIFENTGIVTDDIIKEHKILSESNCDIITEDKKKNDLDLKKCNFCIGFLLPSDFIGSDFEFIIGEVVSYMVKRYMEKTNVTSYQDGYKEMCEEIQVCILVNNKKTFLKDNNGNHNYKILVTPKWLKEEVKNEKDIVDNAYAYVGDQIKLINLTEENEINNYEKIKSKTKDDLKNYYTHVKLIHGKNFNSLLQNMSQNKTKKKEVYVFLAQDKEHQIYYKWNQKEGDSFWYDNDIPYYKYKITYDTEGKKTYTEYKLASEKKFTDGAKRMLKNMFGKEEAAPAGGKTRKHRKRKIRSSKRKASKKGRKSRKKKSSSRKKK